MGADKPTPDQTSARPTAPPKNAPGTFARSIFDPSYGPLTSSPKTGLPRPAAPGAAPAKAPKSPSTVSKAETWWSAVGHPLQSPKKR